MNLFNRLPVSFVRGEGCTLFDPAGNEYLDALSGIAVNTLGHAHPDLVACIASQAARLIHVSNLYQIPEQEMLADALCQRSGLSEAFICNSGTEANEAAIKLARLYGHKKGIENPVIVSMENAFHGRTMGSLAATANPKSRAGFEPMLDGFVRVPFNDLAALEALASSDIVAVMVEAVQGEGGVRPASPAYLQGLRRLCDQRGWLMLCDEVQCGMGRTGYWFGYQHAGIVPDVATLAKGLASGVPIGACLAGGKAAGVFAPGNHGSTFGGNPLACAAALKTIEIIEDGGLIAEARRIGEMVKKSLSAALAGLPGVLEIRGEGLMVGIELDRPCGALVQEALKAGLLINVTHGTVVRLLPALVFGEKEVQQLVLKLSPLVRNFLQN
jgi:acetylornithine aminotransferase